MRDEESETQRKAHAKRVRETRRSTQGVTLDEIKSAEQLVKKKAGNGTTESPSPASVKKSEDTPAPASNDNGSVCSPLAWINSPLAEVEGLTKTYLAGYCTTNSV